MGYLNKFYKNLGTRVEKGANDVLGKTNATNIGFNKKATGKKWASGAQAIAEPNIQAMEQKVMGTSPGESGVPKLGDYKSGLYRADGEPMADRFLKVDPVTGKLDQSGVEGIKSAAFQQGDSPWASMALQKQGLEQSGQMNSATQLAASGAAQNRAAMSARGGLRGGAGMRLANQAGQNSALARQGVLQQGALSRADIGMQDQQRKDSFLSQLPGAQLAAANYGTGVDQFNALQNNEMNKFNIGNKIADNNAGNSWNALGYQEKMKMIGGTQTANAIKSSKQEPGFFSKFIS